PFKVRNTNHTAMAYEYVQSDFWSLDIHAMTGEVTTVKGEKPVSTFNEQLLPDYGIALQFASVLNPASQTATNRLNGFQEATLTHKGAAWLTGVPSNEANPWTFQPAMPINPGLAETDPNSNFIEMIDGTWAPYTLVNKRPGYSFKSNPKPSQLFEAR